MRWSRWGAEEAGGCCGRGCSRVHAARAHEALSSSKAFQAEEQLGGWGGGLHLLNS